MSEEPQFEKDPGFLRDLFGFMKQNKKWWLAPICIVLVLLGALIVLGGSSIAPFVYSFF